MKTKVLFGCILLLSFLAQGLRAQDTAFWFVAPNMSEIPGGPNNIPFNWPAFLAISNGTYQEAHVTITLYNGGSPVYINATIAPGGLSKHVFGVDYIAPVDTFNIKYIENPRSSAGSVVKFGTHIRSDVKVTAYYMHNHTETRDIFTLKGHQALGTQFYVPMQHDNQAQSSSTFGGVDQIDIVATEDNTQVTVVPKARIRIGDSGVSPAGTPIPRTLNKGETLKIMEYTYNENPSLAGTSITATKPIAVTVTEDLVRGDTSGDQIVPVNSLGTRYVVPRGYLTTANLERFYLVAVEANTTVKVYYSGSSYTSITLNNAGDVARYTFPSNVYAVYVEAGKPVYVYQRSGYGEEGAALLPSIYAIGQTQMSFYEVSGNVTGGATLVQKGFIVFRDGTESGFTISHGGAAPTALTAQPNFVTYAIPNETNWKVARFDFNPVPAAGQVITVRSTQSAFSLGYITGNEGNNNSFGYFSAFGTFEFPATTWMCGSSVTLEGGYARSYLWTFPDGSTATTSSITATQEGVYTLVMDQDPNIVTATTTVQRVNAGVINPGEQVICSGDTPAPLSVSGASELTGTQYQWQFSLDNVNWTNIGGATLSGYSPGALTQTTWYRRGMTSDLCAMAYTYGVKVRISSCTLPVNPHLMGRFRGD
jgi:hypothetical protein